MKNLLATNNNPVSFSDSPDLDAFSRLRVSQLTAHCDLKQLHDGLPLFIDKVTNGTATANYNTNQSSTTLATSADGDYAIAQTKQRYLYQSGKGQLILQTFYDFTPQTNIVKRVGAFSSSSVAPYTANFDGIYLESSGGAVSLKIDNNGSNTGTVTQSNWNLDKLDGTGTSGIVIDWSKNQILVIDYQYLGSGRVRIGFDIGGCICYVHEFNHANTTQGVYMKSSNQPFRWEIRQSGAGSGSFTYVCASNNSEGSLNVIGSELAQDTGTTAISCGSVGTTYALLGMRLKSTHLDSVIDILNAYILVTSSDSYIIKLLLNPTVAGTFTYADLANSAVQTAIGTSDNTVTGGTALHSMPFNSGQVLDFNTKNAIRLGSKINGDVDTFVLTLTPITSNINAYASIGWVEES